MFLYKIVFFQCDHPGCMGVLRAAAQKQEQQRMATLEILQVRYFSRKDMSEYIY